MLFRRVPLFHLFPDRLLSVHWALQSNTWRKVWLLLCSHFFYACFFIGDPGAFWAHVQAGEWDQLKSGWWYPFVLMASTCLDYAVGLGIAEAKSEGRRKAWLLASLAANLGVLCFFKYFGFFVSSAADFLRWMNLPVAEVTLKIFLPYGISFYTFQSMSYSRIDVYRQRLAPVHRFPRPRVFHLLFPAIGRRPDRAGDDLPAPGLRETSVEQGRCPRLPHAFLHRLRQEAVRLRDHRACRRLLLQNPGDLHGLQCLDQGCSLRGANL